MIMTSTEKTVDLAELTSRLGRPAHEQQGVAAFADSQGPWTEGEAQLIERVWAGTDPETGVYTEDEAANRLL
jgi:hypothetical protein